MPQVVGDASRLAMRIKQLHDQARQYETEVLRRALSSLTGSAVKSTVQQPALQEAAGLAVRDASLRLATRHAYVPAIADSYRSISAVQQLPVNQLLVQQIARRSWHLLASRGVLLAVGCFAAEEVVRRAPRWLRRTSTQALGGRAASRLELPTVQRQSARSDAALLLAGTPSPAVLLLMAIVLLLTLLALTARWRSRTWATDRAQRATATLDGPASHSQSPPSSQHLPAPLESKTTDGRAAATGDHQTSSSWKGADDDGHADDDADGTGLESAASGTAQAAQHALQSQERRRRRSRGERRTRGERSSREQNYSTQRDFLAEREGHNLREMESPVTSPSNTPQKPRLHGSVPLTRETVPSTRETVPSTREAVPASAGSVGTSAFQSPAPGTGNSYTIRASKLALLSPLNAAAKALSFPTLAKRSPRQRGESRVPAESSPREQRMVASLSFPGRLRTARERAAHSSPELSAASKTPPSRASRESRRSKSISDVISYNLTRIRTWERSLWGV